jgi:hypothetical protein
MANFKVFLNSKENTDKYHLISQEKETDKIPKTCQKPYKNTVSNFVQNPH